MARRTIFNKQQATCPDDSDAWLLREPGGSGIVLDRYTLPLAESVNTEARLSTLLAGVCDVAAVDPVT